MSPRRSVHLSSLASSDGFEWPIGDCEKTIQQHNVKIFFERWGEGHGDVIFF